MYIEQLHISGFRCLKDCELHPGPGINLVIGDNTSGKSSLLEAIYFLGRGRSFRNARTAQMLRHGGNEFVLGCRIQQQDCRPVWLGAQHARGETKFRMDGQGPVPAAKLVSTLPLQVIDPNLHRLIEAGPKHRRQYLDWGVFHVEQAFYPAWRRFRRTLKQRNHALRGRANRNAISAWDEELIATAGIIDACRRRYVHSLSALLSSLLENILTVESFTLDYYSGWAADDSYQEALGKSYRRDCESGYTHAGPHRADLRVQLADTRARGWLSRGQQKVVTSAMLVAQAALLQQSCGILPILLVDDIGAELGSTYRQAIMGVLDELGMQCFLTFLEKSLVPPSVHASAMFHVEHGSLRKEG